MKTSKIGELNLGRYKTQIHATEQVKKELKKQKTSLSNLIPTPWMWYDGELLDILTENGSGTPNPKFGKDFKILYLLESENVRQLEQEALLISKTTIKNTSLKYVVTKT